MSKFLPGQILLVLSVIAPATAIGSINQFPLIPSGERFHISQDDIELKKNMIAEIVDVYRPVIISRFGRDVALKFHTADVFQMLGGHKRNGDIVIEVYGKALVKFSKLAIVSAVCHELGHILGSVTTAAAGNHEYHPLNAVEGEADYFSGSCARKYFDTHIVDVFKESSYCLPTDNGCHQSIEGARDTIRALANKDVDEYVAKDQVYVLHSGINPKYPDNSCRLLSMIFGALELPRPKCWYNPGHSKIP